MSRRSGWGSPELVNVGSRSPSPEILCVPEAPKISLLRTAVAERVVTNTAPVAGTSSTQRYPRDLYKQDATYIPNRTDARQSYPYEERAYQSPKERESSRSRSIDRRSYQDDRSQHRDKYSPVSSSSYSLSRDQQRPHIPTAYRGSNENPVKSSDLFPAYSERPVRRKPSLEPEPKRPRLEVDLTEDDDIITTEPPSSQIPVNFSQIQRKRKDQTIPARSTQVPCSSDTRSSFQRIEKRKSQDNDQVKTPRSHEVLPSNTVVKPPLLLSNLKDVPYPSRLYECKGKLVMLFDEMKCGILNLEGADRRTAFCLFFLNNVFLRGNRDLSAQDLLIGRVLNVNARLMSSVDRIPYMASTVWDIGLDISQSEMMKMFQEPTEKDTEAYYNLSKNYISWRLPGEKTVIVKDHSNLCEGTADKVLNNADKHLSRDSSVECIELDSSSDSDSGGVKKHKRKKKKHSKKKKKKKHKEDMKVDKKERDLLTTVEFKGVVKSYVNDEYGILEAKIGSDTAEVYFNFNQVWHPHNDNNSKQLRELFPTKKLRKIISVGDAVSCSVRKIADKHIQYQALAVWKFYAPKFDYDSELEHELDYQLSVLKYFKKKDQKFLKIDPLPENKKPLNGIIHDYFSDEVGFVRIRNDEDPSSYFITLFHLNEVWVMKKGNFELMRENQQQMLNKEFPVGSSVQVIVRKIPNNSTSELKYQAIAVWKDLEESAAPSFNESIQTMGKKILLANKLEKQYNVFKMLAALDLDPWKANFPFVPVILNGLPNGWIAHISKRLNSLSAIIKILPPKIDDVHHTSLYALCHLEDIYDSNGKSISYSGKNIDEIMHLSVDLTARSICDRLVPMTLIPFAEHLQHTDVWKDQPLLQAINVWVKGVIPCSISRPTMLSSNPGAFGSPDKSYYYLSYKLKAQLERNLYVYLSLTNSRDVFMKYLNPFWKSVTINDEQKIVEKLTVTDVNLSPKLEFGMVDSGALWNPQEWYSLKKSLISVYCKPHLLHREGFTSKCGILGFVLPASTRKCYAYFDISLLKPVSGERKPKDLSVYMPINSAKLFRANLVLSDPKHQVPYIAVNLWDENERKRFKKQIPTINQGKKECKEIAKLRKIISNQCNDVQVVEEISTSKVTTEVNVNKKSCEPLNSAVDLRNKIRSKGMLKNKITESVKSASKIKTRSIEKNNISETVKHTPNTKAKEMVPPYKPCLVLVAPEIPRCQKLDMIDINSVLVVNDEIVTAISNITGYIEKIVGPHHAVVKAFNNIRILCTTADVLYKPAFKIKSYTDYRFSRLTYQNQNLEDVLSVGDPVKCNATILLGKSKSRISYVCSCLIYGDNLSIPVPVLSVKSCESIEPKWKQHYSIMINSLDENLHINNDSLGKIENAPLKYLATTEEDLFKLRSEKDEDLFHYLKPQASSSALQSKSAVSKEYSNQTDSTKNSLVATEYNSLDTDDDPNLSENCTNDDLDSIAETKSEPSTSQNSAKCRAIEVTSSGSPIKTSLSIRSDLFAGPASAFNAGKPKNENVKPDQADSGALEAIKVEKSESISCNQNPILYLHNVIGKVVRVLNDDYAVAIVRADHSEAEKSVKVIFDIYDLWLDDLTLASDKKKLSEIISFGQYIKMNAIQADNLCADILLGTAAIVSSSKEEIETRIMPPNAIFLTSAHEINEDKIQNFAVLKRILQNIKFSETEKLIIETVNSGSYNVPELLLRTEICYTKENQDHEEIAAETRELAEDSSEKSEIHPDKAVIDREDANLPVRQTNLVAAEENHQREGHVNAEDDFLMKTSQEAIASSSKIYSTKENNFQEEISDDLGFSMISVSSIKEENFMKSNVYEENISTEASPLPRFVTNKTGALIAIMEDTFIIKFEIALNYELKINSFALMEKASLMRCEKTSVDNYKIGYPVTFHAVSLDSPDESGDYIVSMGYIDGSQTVKEKFVQAISQEDWISQWSGKQDISVLKGKVIDHMKVVNSFQRKIPCTLSKSIGRVMKTSKDIIGKCFTTVVKVERFDLTCFALLLSEAAPNFSENDSVYINALQLDEKSTVNYLVTAVWSLDGTDVAPVDYGYLSLAQVDGFYQYLSHSEEILFLTILMNESNKEFSRMTETLSKISVQHFRALVNSYVKNLEKVIDIEDFDSAKEAKSPIALSSIKAEANLDMENDELLELLISINKSYQICGASGCLQFLTLSDLETISMHGMQACVESLPKTEPERLQWKIPADWVQQAACMAWEEIVLPPVIGAPSDWDLHHDNELMIGAAVHGLLDYGQTQSDDLWTNLSDDTR